MCVQELVLLLVDHLLLGSKLSLQVGHLLLMLAQLLIPLFLHGLPEVLQGFPRMLVLLLQRPPVLLVSSMALLKICDLLSKLRPEQGLVTKCLLCVLVSLSLPYKGKLDVFQFLTEGCSLLRHGL